MLGMLVFFRDSHHAGLSYNMAAGALCLGGGIGPSGPAENLRLLQPDPKELCSAE